MSISASKNSLVRELFVRTADENYVTARWCAMNQLDIDFLWLAVHALEKYLKAVLLLNGHSSRNHSHNIVSLYDAVKTFAADLLPTLLQRPPGLDVHHWFDRTPEAFIERLLDNGNADNRYLIYGYSTRLEDLYMLDTMVFAIRRLVCELDAEEFAGRPGLPAGTHRDRLLANPHLRRDMSMPLDKLLASTEDTPKRRAALNLNLPFAPNYPHEPMAAVISAVNPVILRRIMDPLASDNREWAAEGVDLARWFLANVQVPRGRGGVPGVAEEIQSAIDAAAARHGLP